MAGYTGCAAESRRMTDLKREGHLVPQHSTDEPGDIMLSKQVTKDKHIGFPHPRPLEESMGVTGTGGSWALLFSGQCGSFAR